MAGVHPLEDLAPRHVVAQTIYGYLREGKPVCLDVSHIQHFSKKFPTVAALCKKNGIDWNNGIPVAPGSHFLMGGIKTDVAGRTNIPGLYAIGEAACTGLHGANRLASNSLLEGLFMGKKLAEWINAQPSNEKMRLREKEELPDVAQSRIRLWEKAEITDAEQSRFRFPKKEDMQRSMMDHAGIVRTEAGLKKHMRWLESFHIDKWTEASLDAMNIHEIERIFMGICSWLIADAALKRTESRGGHFRLDFPCENDHEWAGKRIIQCRKRRGRDEQIKTPVAAGTIFSGRYR
jgi:L-aspartate oxidase